MWGEGVGGDGGIGMGSAGAGLREFQVFPGFPSHGPLPKPILPPMIGAYDN